MDHTPFIIASYAATALVLGWCALAPILRMRRLRRDLVERQRRRTLTETA